MHKPHIKQIVVVEGHKDTNKLKKLFDVETIETNGSAIDVQTINLIKHAANTRGVILFLDPDGPGEKIRKTISEHLIVFDNAFISKQDMQKGTKKIGVAEADDEAIIKAFANLIKFDKTNNSITWEEYLSLSLNNKQKRNLITKHYNISECNHKQLFKRLNMMNVSLSELKQVLKNE